MKEYSVWLSLVKNVSKHTKMLLMDALGGGRGVYEASPSELLAAVPMLNEKELEALSRKDIGQAGDLCRTTELVGAYIIDCCDRLYPPLLRCISDPPTVLYVKGELPDMSDRLTVGVVGQRKATPNGMNNAMKLAYDLSRNGVIIVSGMAAGIDGCAHRGALDGGSPTVAVFGTPIDKCYPAENAELMGRIIENGAVVSEYYPGAAINAKNFVARNRIISGMSRGVLVVEARERSGSLVTARRACEQDRDIFAVPGPIETPDYVGTNRLIKEGAAVVTGAADILSSYGYEHTVQDAPHTAQERHAASREPRPGARPLPEGEDGAILRAIGAAATLDEIAERVDMDPGELTAKLTMLELRGEVVRKPGNYYELKER